MSKERRFSRGKVELRNITDEQKAAGYIGVISGFIPYESDSRQMRDSKGRDFVERLARGVFTQSLADNARSVVADVGHNDAALFARRGVNLDVTEAEDGLRYTALIPDTTAGRDLKTNVQLGIIEGTSFEFELRGGDAGHHIEKRGDGVLVRTVRNAILHRVNPVTDPAYLGTELEARSLDLAPTELPQERPQSFPMRSLWAARLGLRK